MQKRKGERGGDTNAEGLSLHIVWWGGWWGTICMLDPSTPPHASHLCTPKLTVGTKMSRWRHWDVLQVKIRFICSTISVSAIMLGYIFSWHRVKLETSWFGFLHSSFQWIDLLVMRWSMLGFPDKNFCHTLAKDLPSSSLMTWHTKKWKFDRVFFSAHSNWH